MSGSKKQKQTQENKVDIPDYMKPYMTGALSDASALYSRGGFAPKQTRSAETLKANTMALDLADYLQGTALPGFEASINDLRNKRIVGSPEFTAAVDAATRPVMDNLARYAIPQTQDAAISAGQRGSSRQGIAEGLARSDANSQILDTTSKMSYNALGEEINNARLATQLTPTLMQLMGLPTQLVAGVGAGNDAFENANAQSEANNLLQYAQLLKLFTPNMDSTSTTTSKTSTGAAGVLGNVLGGVGGMASMMGGFGPLMSLFTGGLGAAAGGTALGASGMNAAMGMIPTLSPWSYNPK